MKKILYLIRGLPGSGKTTLARKLTSWNFAADDFFTDEDGTYAWDPSRIGEAHEDCLRRTERSMTSAGGGTIAVHNTFLKLEHMQPYYVLANKYGYAVSEIVCTGDFGNEHGVPDDRVEAMRRAFEWRKPLGQFPGHVELGASHADPLLISMEASRPISLQLNMIDGHPVLTVHDPENDMLVFGGYDGSTKRVFHGIGPNGGLDTCDSWRYQDTPFPAETPASLTTTTRVERKT